MEINSSIPIPERYGKTGRKRKYPFDKMKVGDSFDVPFTGESQRVTVNQSARLFGCKCTTRKVVVEGVQMLRVWKS